MSKRVLHFQGRMGKGGAESFMMNLYRKIDLEQYQFDFLIYDDYANITDYHDEIKQMGGNIYTVTNPKKNIIKYIYEVNQLLKAHNFDIVHNEVYFGGGINLWLAKKNHIKQRIAHSHATSDGKSNFFGMGILRDLLYKLLIANATDFLAVSKEAGESLFRSHPYEIIHNGVDLDIYTNANGKSVRKELGLAETDFVIGNVGRLEKQKNQKYLIEIFYHLKEVKNNAKLILVGEGSLSSELTNQVAELGLKKDVFFLGNRKDIPDIMECFDIFVMTSLYEGLPMVGIEAQASRKKLVLSNMISKDTKLTENVHFLPLSEDYQPWVDEILREPYTNEITESLKEYDSVYTLNQMMKIYNESKE